MTSKDGFLVHNINWIHHLDCSGISGSPPPYQTLSGDVKGATYGSSLSRHDAAAPIIFCVHGNKFGMARCCDDLHAGTDDENQENGVQHGESGSRNDRITSANSTVASDNSSEHCHSAREGYALDTKARRKLIIASVMCLFFMIVEIVGGVLANSLAIATDAAHLLTDLASFMISLFAIWLASRPATRTMSFGWHRAEVGSNK